MTIRGAVLYVKTTLRYASAMPDRAQLRLCLAVDLAILTVRENRLQVLVAERASEPYRGYPALPGGFLRDDEDLDQAAGRVLAEEAGLDRAALHLEQLVAYGAPGRDPSGRVVSVAYLAFAPDLPMPSTGPDAHWAPARIIRGALAFDHAGILDDAIERAGARLEYTTLATAFCGPAFTIGDLRTIYEAVWDTPLDPRNFNRKVLHTEGFVEPTGDKRIPGTGRPAALYRRGPASALSPPLLRSTTATSP
jgi:8-oxo-dGTP diphosphatase